VRDLLFQRGGTQDSAAADSAGADSAAAGAATDTLTKPMRPRRGHPVSRLLLQGGGRASSWWRGDVETAQPYLACGSKDALRGGSS